MKKTYPVACRLDSSRRCYPRRVHLDTPRLSPLVGPSQHSHYQPTLEGKTELCVKRGSYRIITIQMQKWRLAARIDLSNKCTNQRGCITTPSVPWVSTHRRNFCEFIKPHSLARHGNELARVANTEVRAKLDRPCREGTGPCQFDQVQHGGVHLRARIAMVWNRGELSCRSQII